MITASGGIAYLGKEKQTMAGNKNSGRKSNAKKLLDAGFIAPWFTAEFQKKSWIELCSSVDERIRLDAVKYVTDRLYGKATERKELSGPEGKGIPLDFINDL